MRSRERGTSGLCDSTQGVFGTTSLAAAPRLEISKQFAVIQLVAAAFAVTISFLASVGPVIGAWAPLFTGIFISGGWFHRELDNDLGWPSAFLFLYAVAMPAALSRSLWFVGLFTYVAAVFARKAFGGGEKTSVRSSTSSKIFFSVLALYGLILLIATFPSILLDPILSIPIIPFAMAGWFFPEVSKVVGSGPGRSQTSGLVTYIAIMSSALAFAIFLGASATPVFLAWVLALTLLLLLRTNFPATGKSN